MYMEEKNIFNTITNDAKLINEVKPRQKRIRKNIEKTPVDKKDISFKNYTSNAIDLQKYKLPDLKSACKLYSLKITGKKELLIQRLDALFKNTKYAIHIQRLFRGWMIREFIKLKGPGFKNRTLCVNDTDFVTMEPLREIKNDYFFSYTDAANFTYGFDITSLIHIMKSNMKLQNPYNREKISQQMSEKIRKVYRLSFIVYNEFKNDNEPFNTTPPSTRNSVYNRQSARIQHTNTMNAINQQTNVMNERIRETQLRIAAIRLKSVQERINLLFTEIDALGNYTQSSWFSNLELRSYLRLYRATYEIWNYRSNLSREVRNLICPNQSPFDGVLPRTMYHSDISFEQIQLGCLTVFENMIYSGVNEENRRLGTFHALSALTLVSDGARQSMPWLYESVAY